jgi:hypothetical protein
MRSFTESEFASLLVPKTASPQFCESSHSHCATRVRAEIFPEWRDDGRKHALDALRLAHVESSEKLGNDR